MLLPRRHARADWKGSLPGQIPAVTSLVIVRVSPDLAGAEHRQHRPKQIVRGGHERDLLPDRVRSTDPVVERAQVR